MIHPNAIKSQVYLCLQVLEREQIMNKFQEMTAELEQALSGISFEKLDMSDEVKEQVRYDPSFGLYLMWSWLLLGHVYLLLQPLYSAFSVCNAHVTR